MQKGLALFLGLLACGGSAPPAGAPEDAGSPQDVGSPTDAPPVTCDAPPPKDVPVSSLDLQGYPPYAADGCTLVYVAPGAQAGVSGDLRIRDLASGVESTLAPASESPRRPTIGGDVVAWEAKDGTRAVVRVRVNGTTTTMTGAFDHAGEPRATADAVVFTAWRGVDTLADTDVLSYEVASTRTEVVFGGAGQQRFADVSRGYVAAADFSEDPDGV